MMKHFARVFMILCCDIPFLSCFWGCFWFCVDRCVEMCHPCLWIVQFDLDFDSLYRRGNDVGVICFDVGGWFFRRFAFWFVISGMFGMPRVREWVFGLFCHGILFSMSAAQNVHECEQIGGQWRPNI